MPMQLALICDFLGFGLSECHSVVVRLKRLLNSRSFFFFFQSPSMTYSKTLTFFRLIAKINTHPIAAEHFLEWLFLSEGSNSVFEILVHKKEDVNAMADKLLQN